MIRRKDMLGMCKRYDIHEVSGILREFYLSAELTAETFHIIVLIY